MNIRAFTPISRVGELQWVLRYGEPTKSELLAVAAILSQWEAFVYAPSKARQSVINHLREERITAGETE